MIDIKEELDKINMGYLEPYRDSNAVEIAKSFLIRGSSYSNEDFDIAQMIRQARLKAEADFRYAKMF